MSYFVKLGKKPTKHDSRTFMLAKYLSTSLPAPPATVDNTKGRTAWGMMLNDTIGDCTIAAAGHMTEEWTGTTPADPCILLAYEAVSGYNPANPASDTGCYCIDVLNYWRQTGICNHKITAFAKPSPTITHLKQAIYLFGGVYIGVELPLSAQGQTVWTWEPDSKGGAVGSWGGHCVPVVGYDEHRLTFISWGQVMQMTYGFWDKYVSESYAPLSSEWSLPGFNFTQLQADLAAL